MKRQVYIAPVIENISVELERGIAQSAAPAGYGGAGEAGMAGDESGSTNW